jgi:nucleoside-diphosphate-sugar epimerase
MRYLVSGGSGLIGSFLLPRLVELGHSVLNYDIHAMALDPYDLHETVTGNVLDYDSLLCSIKGWAPDILIHLAAQSGVTAAKEDRVASMDLSIDGTRNVLEACLQAKVPTVLTASTNHVYGSMSKVPWLGDGNYQEDHVSMRRRDWYTVGKICADMLTQGYAHNYGLRAVSVRPTNTYGPGDPHHEHIVPATILSLMDFKQPIIQSDGTIQKSYLYGTDAADAFIAIAENAERFKGTAVNVVGSRPVAVSLLVDLIRETFSGVAIDKTTKAVVKGNPYDGASEFLDGSKLREVGWEPKVSLEDGIRQTIEAFRAKVAV